MQPDLLPILMFGVPRHCSHAAALGAVTDLSRAQSWPAIVQQHDADYR
jgi:hypothetical protein